MSVILSHNYYERKLLNDFGSDLSVDPSYVHVHSLLVRYTNVPVFEVFQYIYNSITTMIYLIY